jgi:THO complex subunit 5
MVQREINEISSLDPLLLLPVPDKLPASPESSLEPLLDQINAVLEGRQTTSIALLTAQMRILSRHAQILLNAARVRAADARQGLDQVDVHLKGVEYERERVKDETIKCLSYT